MKTTIRTSKKKTKKGEGIPPSSFGKPLKKEKPKSPRDVLSDRVLKLEAEAHKKQSKKGFKYPSFPTIFGDQNSEIPKPPATPFIVNYGEWNLDVQSQGTGTRIHKIVMNQFKGKHTRRETLQAFHTLMTKPKYHDLYLKEVHARIFQHINAALDCRKRNKIYIFDIDDLFLGVSDGYIHATSQLNSALAQLGFCNQGMSLFPIWKHEITPQFVRNVLRPLWSVTPYPATTLLDIDDTDLEILDSRYWIVKCIDTNQLNQCMELNIRSCPYYEDVIGQSKNIREIRENQSYKNWIKQSWNTFHQPVWWHDKDKAPNKQLAKLCRTLRLT